MHDMVLFDRVAAKLGLSLNQQKSEVICEEEHTRTAILAMVPEARVVSPSEACLLGSIGDVGTISSIIDEKVHLLEIIGDRLQHLDSHDAILLLRHSFSIPKFLYTLRTSPCFLSSSLELYVERLRSIISSITNIHLGPNDPTWIQASLPVKKGGLGISSAVQLAPSSFLASATSSSDLAHRILPPLLQSAPFPYVEDAVVSWFKATISLSLLELPPTARKPGISQEYPLLLLLCWTLPRMLHLQLAFWPPLLQSLELG